MAFSAEALQKLKDELRRVPSKHVGLVQAFLGRNFVESPGHE
jgi:hypothetical protein